MNFRDFIRELSPAWLRRKWGERFLYTFGALADVAHEHLHQGFRARFPGRTKDPASLEFIGRDRVLRRGHGEPDAAYKERLKAWLDTHRTRGNPFTLLREIRAYLSTYSPIRLRYVNDRGTWFTLDENGVESWLMTEGNWLWDDTSLDPSWSRFWIIIYPLTSGFAAPAGLWGDDGETWGDDDGLGWGSSATTQQGDAIRQIITDGKSQGSRCPYIIICEDPAEFDPSGAGWPYQLPEEVAWSDNILGTQEPVRVGTALYWKGPLT